MRVFWKYKLDHILFWTTTIVFHLYTRVNLIDKAGWAQLALEVGIRNILLAIVIYTHLLGLFPKLQERKILFYVISLLVLMAGYVLAKNVHDAYLYGHVLGIEARRSLVYSTYYNFSIILFYLAFSVALQLSKEWYFQRARLRQMEVEKLNTELEYLRSQINPHFLFNSINTIFFQIDKQNTQARESLSQFSDMLRYQLYECNGKEIAIEKELTYLKNYVNIQRMRKDENYTIEFTVEEDVRNFTLAPLLMIPFVENAFKYVSHYTERKNLISIALHKTENIFSVQVSNTKDSLGSSVESGGIGLKNVKRRLDLLYPDRHQLTIQETPDRFDVTLTLTIDPV